MNDGDKIRERKNRKKHEKTAEKTNGMNSME
jgi:hypothetical protein